MATTDNTPNDSEWNEVLANSDAAHAAATAIEQFPQSRIRDEILALNKNATDQLSRTPAQTIRDVRRKVELLWDDIFEETDVAHARRIILGDLHRLSLLEVGVAWEEASGGMDREKYSRRWEEAAADYDHCLEVHDSCHSKNGPPRTAIAALDSAELRMVVIPAMDLGALEKKLEALWVNRTCLQHTDAHTTILRDVRRLVERKN